MKTFKNLSKGMILTLILILFFLTLSITSAADIHINTTNDTLSNVVDMANDTDNIYLDTGTYNFSHISNVNGIIVNKNLTIVGKSRENTIIDAEKNWKNIQHHNRKHTHTHKHNINQWKYSRCWWRNLLTRNTQNNKY
ncbi:hypothetical protein [Methanobrevibacter arboriphilus]|uniref:hypothetical protein n=1 Tax=Methanobrevibacter arboriphilus TaxID=39441 RepID=UPI001CDA626F|nr:hypothetical protein [Methanobrevibacter arboriphilus]